MKQGGKRRRRPSAALVVSMAALVMSISGVAVALPGKNTVNSGDIVNETIRGKDIAENAITSSCSVGSCSEELGPDTIGSSELSSGSVTAKALSPTGVTQGPQAESPENSTNQKSVQATCDSGSVAIGASVLTFDSESSAVVDKEVAITDSFRSSQNAGRDWIVLASETDDISETWKLVVRPICFG
jgi:hypothetical protein